jgi:hypothetical protein
MSAPVATLIHNRGGADRRDPQPPRSYFSRVLRLTLLAPEIVEAILDRQPAEMTLAVLMRRFPLGWREQEKAFN